MPEGTAELCGTGIGLRGPHIAELEQRPAGTVGWLELLADNYLGLDPRAWNPLRRLRRDYPMALHSVGISIAGVDPLDIGYLESLRALADELEIDTLSDHLCWTSLEGVHHHDLLPPPYTEEALTHVVERVLEAQDILGRPLLLENISSYVQFQSSCTDEVHFLAELVERSGCGLLVDLNNLFVNEQNLGHDSGSALCSLPVEHIGYLHLSGHTQEADLRVDTHDAPICEPVWELFREVLRRRPEVPAVIEWDHHLPELAVLLQEQQRAESHRLEISAKNAA